MPLIETTGSASAKALGFNKVSGSATYIEDVFSTYLYDGGSGNGIIVNNGISLQGPQNTGGSVKFTSASNQRLTLSSQVTFFTGTIEAWIYPTTTDDMIVFSSTTDSNAQYFRINESGNIGAVSCYINGASISPTGTYIQVNKWNHIAACFTGSTVRLLVNGVLAGSTSFSATVYFGVIGAFYLSGNFYGNPFNGYISNVRAIDGTALYSGAYNIPSAPLSLYSGSATKLLALQGSTPFTNNASSGITLNNINTAVADTNGPTITNDGTGGLVWIKNRSTTSNQVWADTTRQPYYLLYSNSGNAQTYDASAVTNFLPNGGFGLGAGTDTNNSSYKYTSWTFKKKAKFFDIVTWTGNDTSRAISHSLGSVPGCIFVKRVDGAGSYSWIVWHRAYNSGNGYAYLNTTNAFAVDNGLWWGNGSTYTAPTSTNFTISGEPAINQSGVNYVAYLFAHDAGGFGLTGTDNVISCGSFTASGGLATVNLGYEPQWLMFKQSNGAGNWAVYDVMRGIPTGRDKSYLAPNTSGAEVGALNPFDVTATGFNVTNSYAFPGTGSGNETFVYIAIRRGPMKTPTSGTSVFSPAIYTGNDVDGRLISSGFPVDGAIIDPRNGYLTPGGPNWFSRLTGNGYFLQTAQNYAESNGSSNSNGIMGQDGITVSRNGSNVWSNVNPNTYVAWFLRRAPSFYDVVCYTGTGTNRTVTHNLTVTPELMIVKSRNNAYNWNVYSADVGNTKYLKLNTLDAPATDSTVWNNTSPTSSVFTVGTANAVNANATTYVAYLFASCPGVSKVGSYTGNGTSQTINCGFASGARFVLIKETSGTGNWAVWDTARGMTSGGSPSLYLNSTAAEGTPVYVTTTSVGFNLTTSTFNSNGVNYIFLAIA